jgi:hypothetical protein
MHHASGVAGRSLEASRERNGLLIDDAGKNIVPRTVLLFLLVERRLEHSVDLVGQGRNYSHLSSTQSLAP